MCRWFANVGWFSRDVLSWRLSTSPHAESCVNALEEALDCCGRLKIFNLDQGSQFTNVLLDARVDNSMMARADGWTMSLSSVCAGR